MSNYSMQREKILRVIKESKTHLTAEEIYNLIQEVDTKISKSTVYRNISILTDEGHILKVTMVDGPDKYEFPHNPHYHAICEKCGKLFDVVYPFETDKISQTIKDQNKISFEIKDITVYGICQNCASK